MSRKRKSFLGKPWLTKGLKVSIKTKNKLYKSESPLKNYDQKSTHKYKLYCTLLNRLKYRSKNNYYADLALRYGNDKAKLGNLINEITHRKRTSRKNINSLTNKDGGKIYKPDLIANSLNDHFSSIGQKMASRIEKKTNRKNPLEYISTEIENPVVLEHIIQKDVSKLIQNLDSKKACGYDLISNKILKSCCSTIAPYITSLFNLCFKDGIFPDIFKIAHVVPLFKGGDKNDPSCYRPISLLPSLGKLLEKVVSTQIVDYLNENNLISNKQYGFREGFSTELAVLDIYEKLLSNLDKGMSSCTIFLDLAKAFDSVNHNIL